AGATAPGRSSSSATRRTTPASGSRPPGASASGRSTTRRRRPSWRWPSCPARSTARRGSSGTTRPSRAEAPSAASRYRTGASVPPYPLPDPMPKLPPGLLAPPPDAAPPWLSAAGRDLAAADAAALLARVRAFTAGWTCHARPGPAAAALLLSRVLAVGAAVDESEVNAGVSGCGIDAMQHAVEAAAEAGGFAWLPPLAVLYRDDEGALQAVPRPDFRRLVRDGVVNAGTPVLDLTPTTVGALRAGGVERAAGRSWHGRVFGLGEPVAAGA